MFAPSSVTHLVDLLRLYLLLIWNPNSRIPLRPHTREIFHQILVCVNSTKWATPIGFNQLVLTIFTFPQTDPMVND